MPKTSTPATPAAPPAARPKPENHYAGIYAGFTKNTTRHELVILKDDGLYRHLRVQKPGTRIWSWDIVTWPGHLAITGDVGAGFVFSRLEDMIQFFAGRRQDYHHDGAPSIDHRYWAEKLVGGRSLEVKGYDEKTFLESVKDLLDEHDELSLEAIAEIRGEDPEEAGRLQERRDEYLEEAQNVADEGASPHRWLQEKAGDGVIPSDWYEVPTTDYDPQFLYACYCIELAVRLYTATKQGA